MKLSMTWRNLLGGFLGGALGILGSVVVEPVPQLPFGMLPIGLPLGVLIGVLGVWLVEEVIQIFTTAHRFAQSAAGTFMGASDLVVTGLARLCGLPKTITTILRWVIVNAIIGSIVAVVSVPARFRRWLASHPTNPIHAINVATSFMLWVAVPLAVWLIEPFLGLTFEGSRGVLTFCGIFAALGGTTLYIVQHENSPNSYLKDMGQFYREWEVTSHRGLLGYFGYAVAIRLRYTVGLTVFAALVIPWVLGVAVVGFIGIMVLMIVFGLATGVYAVVARASFWLCLGVTLVVTSSSWFIYHESFASQIAVGFAMLFTGIASGVATELLRQLLLMFYGKTQLGVFLTTEDAFDHLVGGEDAGYFGFVSTKIAGMWFRQNLLARVFRWICFGFSTARQVRIVLPPKVKTASA